MLAQGTGNWNNFLKNGLVDIENGRKLYLQRIKSQLQSSMTHFPVRCILKKCIAVIPSVEGWHLLSRLLPTIDLPKDQIFVVDQGSQDKTEQKCKESGYQCIQMHARATFTEALNRGVREALDRGADYVLVLNNDIEFLTHVATQLMNRAENETHLGIIAPRQIIATNNKDVNDVKRTVWELTKVHFYHEIGEAQSTSELLEADCCEFTCALIKNSVFQAIGMLDDRYQFYHEDADFCFRAHLAGFRCAYDQTALIKHFSGSTFNKQKTYKKKRLIQRNKKYFSVDHLKYHVSFPFVNSPIACSWNTTNEFLGHYLKKYGLLSPRFSTPTLSPMVHPGTFQTDYLLTVWETSQLPGEWVKEAKKHKHVFVPSLWNKQVFESCGLTNVSLLPFGVETDLFHPWGKKLSLPWEKSILCVFQNQYRKALDVTLRMWGQIRSRHPKTFLVLYGKEIELTKLKMNNCFSERIGDFIVRIDWDHRIALLQPAFTEYVSHENMATLYRSCEIFLLNSRSEGFGYPILEAMACGALCVVPNYGATKEFIQEQNCIFFEGTPVKANYSDKGFGDVGNWWEPDLNDLGQKVQQALRTDEQTKALITYRARQTVLSHFTWRCTMRTLRKHLEQIQFPSTHGHHQEVRSFATRCRKQSASAMHSAGRFFLKTAAVMESHELKEIVKKVGLKIFNKTHT